MPNLQNVNWEGMIVGHSSWVTFINSMTLFIHPPCNIDQYQCQQLVLLVLTFSAPTKKESIFPVGSAGCSLPWSPPRRFTGVVPRAVFPWYSTASGSFSEGSLSFQLNIILAVLAYIRHMRSGLERLQMFFHPVCSCTHGIHLLHIYYY